jgi:hypothetical protein
MDHKWIRYRSIVSCNELAIRTASATANWNAERSARMAKARSTSGLITRCYATRNIFKMATLSTGRVFFFFSLN